MTKQITIGIGSKGHQHKGWLESYYPEDMPEEWQLEFYAHEFHSLLLPASEFPDTTTWREWCDTLDERFRLFIELPEGVSNEMRAMVTAEPVVKGLFDQGATEFGDGGFVVRDLEQGLAVLKTAPVIKQIVYIADHSTGEPLDLKDWKQRLSALVEATPEGAALDVILGGAPPSIEALRQLATLVELMGWS